MSLKGLYYTAAQAYLKTLKSDIRRVQYNLELLRWPLDKLGTHGRLLHMAASRITEALP
jgi:hypothetical protein